MMVKSLKMFLQLCSVLSVVLSVSAYAYGEYEFVYRSKISKMDQINSRGIYLHSINSILRQDRANLYRYGGDPGDTRDPLYFDPAARSTIEYARIVPLNSTYSQLKKAISAAQPYIEVGKRGNVLYVKLLSNAYVDTSTCDARTIQSGGSQVVYQARLSYKDHYNSRGKWLDSIGSILRQDRANYYKFGGDAEDTPDYFFRSRSSRSALEYSRIIPVDMSYEELRRVIVEENPLVEVRSSGNETYISIIGR